MTNRQRLIPLIQPIIRSRRQKEFEKPTPTPGLKRGETAIEQPPESVTKYPDLSVDFSEQYQSVYSQIIHQLEQARKEAVNEGKNPFHAERKILRQTLKENEQFGLSLKDSFHNHFNPDKDKFPMKWWFRNTRGDKSGDVIEKRYKNQKDKVFARMIALMNYLWRNRIVGNGKEDACERIAEKIGAGRYKTEDGIERPFGFIKVLDFKDMEKEIGGYSRMTILHDMDEMAEKKMLWKFKRIGPHGHTTWAIGYLVPMQKGNSQARVVPFVQNSEEYRKALASFGLGRNVG